MTEQLRILSQLRAALGRYIILFGPGLSFFLAALVLHHIDVRSNWFGVGYPTLLCFLTLWGTLSAEPILVRGSRCVCQIASFYFFFLLADTTLGERHERQVPTAIAYSILSFVVATFLAAGVLRLFSFRLTYTRESSKRTEVSPLQVGQFRLAKLFQLTTASAIFLGLGVATIPKFRDEPEGCLPGIGHAVLVFISLILCGPFGVLTVLLAWIVMGAGFVRTRIVIATVLGAIWTVCLLFLFRLDDDYWASFTFWLLLFLTTWMVIIGGIARLLGWRIVRIPRAVRPAPDAATGV